jgi:hypothetical protein
MEISDIRTADAARLDLDHNASRIADRVRHVSYGNPLDFFENSGPHSSPPAAEYDIGFIFSRRKSK